MHVYHYRDDEASLIGLGAFGVVFRGFNDAGNKVRQAGGPATMHERGVVANDKQCLSLPRSSVCVYCVVVFEPLPPPRAGVLERRNFASRGFGVIVVVFAPVTPANSSKTLF